MNRGTKRQAPTESSNQSETNENLSADDSISVPGTATYNEHLSQISGGKRRRKRFTAAERLRVAKVRKAGACKSCRRRKVKVCQPLMCLVMVISLFQSQMLISRSVVHTCPAGDRCPPQFHPRTEALSTT
jgi:hypothetical protein